MTMISSLWVDPDSVIVPWGGMSSCRDEREPLAMTYTDSSDTNTGYCSCQSNKTFRRSLS